MSALLEAEALSKRFLWRHPGLPWRRRYLQALAGVSLRLEAGECLGVVGESGSGKTTLARCLIRLHEPDGGRVRLAGEDLLALDRRRLRRRRRDAQLIFQDPQAALDARMRIGALVAEPLAIHRLAPPPARAARAAELLEQVGLAADLAGRYPHELSGGQRQRVAIARALACAPRLLIADEAVSALDVSVQAQILALLARLVDRGLGMIFISHDLAVVERVAGRVLVFYLGRVVESGSRRALFGRPLHPYTVSLLAAVPQPAPGRRRPPPVAGEVASALAPPPGCPFHPRCPIARERCRSERPALVDAGGGHAVACHYPGEVDVPPARP